MTAQLYGWAPHTWVWAVVVPSSAVTKVEACCFIQKVDVYVILAVRMSGTHQAIKVVKGSRKMLLC